MFSFLDRALPKYRIDFHSFLQIVLYNSGLYELLICSVLPTLHLPITTIYCPLPDSQNEKKHSMIMTMVDACLHRGLHTYILLNTSSVHVGAFTALQMNKSFHSWMFASQRQSKCHQRLLLWMGIMWFYFTPKVYASGSYVALLERCIFALIWFHSQLGPGVMY